MRNNNSKRFFVRSVFAVWYWVAPAYRNAKDIVVSTGSIALKDRKDMVMLKILNVLARKSKLYNKCHFS